MSRCRTSAIPTGGVRRVQTPGRCGELTTQDTRWSGVADGEPLLRPRRSLGSGRKDLAERRDVARDLLQAGRQRLDVGALRRTEHALEPDVEPVHRVLDAL